MALATIFGAAGAMLVLVGLIGGGFTFSGSIMPRVGGLSRVLCFGVGGVLLVLSLGIVVAEGTATATAGQSPADPSRSGSEPPAATPPAEATPPSGAAPPAAATLTPAVPSTVPPPVGPSGDAAPVGSSFGSIVVPTGTTALVFELPSTGSDVITELPAGTGVEIVCTVQGETMTSPVTGATSSLWNGTTDGGFVPDVLVDTGTDQPTAPNCLG